MSESHEPSYYEIALTNRQVLVAFVGQQDSLHRGVQAPCGARRAGPAAGPTPLLLRGEYAPAASRHTNLGRRSVDTRHRLPEAGAFRRRSFVAQKSVIAPTSAKTPTICQSLR